MFRRVRPFVAAAGAALISVAVAGAQTVTPQPRTAQAPAPVKVSAEATLTAVIQAIDSTSRIVTLKAPDGTLKTVLCGPEVLRFNELKVGDSVTFRYYESVVFAISAPGAPPPPAPATGIVRSGGEKPAGVMAQRETVVVTVLAIDAAVPSITIQRQDGSKASFKIENPKNLEGVKVGDKVQITYTQALAISVK